MRYAIIDAGIVINVAEADEPLADNWVQSDTASPGWLYDDQTEEFSPPLSAQPRPLIVITDIVCDDQNAAIQPGDVTCAAGSSVAVTAELRDPSGSGTLPVSAAFRMPLVARDGRERYLLAAFADGVATIATTLAESGCWQIEESTINRDLPDEQHMSFAGLRIFVLQ